VSWAISLHSGDVQELQKHSKFVKTCFHVGALVVRPDPDLCHHCRPLSKEEVATGVHQVITCNERAREVVVSQSMGGKTLGRSFHFDKVGNCRCLPSPYRYCPHAQTKDTSNFQACRE